MTHDSRRVGNVLLMIRHLERHLHEISESHDKEYLRHVYLDSLRVQVLVLYTVCN